MISPSSWRLDLVDVIGYLENVHVIDVNGKFMALSPDLTVQ